MKKAVCAGLFSQSGASVSLLRICDALSLRPCPSAVAASPSFSSRSRHLASSSDNENGAAGPSNTNAPPSSHSPTAVTSSSSSQASSSSSSSGGQQRSRIYPNSKAHLRARRTNFSLFAHEPIVPRTRDDVISPAQLSEGSDKDIRAAVLNMHASATSQNLEKAIAHARKIATLVATRNDPALYLRQPFHHLLMALASKGMVDESLQVLRDMERCGVKATAATLNLVLRAAVKGESEFDVQEVLNRIRTLPSSSGVSEGAVTDESSGNKLDASHKITVNEETGSIDFPVHNFTADIFSSLFMACRASRNVEKAMLVFAALVKQKSTPAQAFSAFLRPVGVQHLIELLLENREFRIALDTANWLESTVGARAMSKLTWASIARASAAANFYEGLEASYDIVFAASSPSRDEPGVVLDEGLFLSALSVASGRPDSQFCLKLISDFAAGVFTGPRDTEPGPASSMPYPEDFIQLLDQGHLAPLVDAYALEGKYIQAMRLIGATRTLWGKTRGESPDDIALGSRLEYRAKKDIQSLTHAVQEWTVLMAEAHKAADAVAKGLGTEKPPMPVGAKKRALWEAALITKVAEGQMPIWYTRKCKAGAAWMLDVVVMNSLLRAAARLGETDLALSIWESAKPRKEREPGHEGQKRSSRVAHWLTASNSSVAAERSGLARGLEDATLTKSARVFVQPDVETFNALLWACQTRRPIPAVQLALSIFDEMTADADTRGGGGGVAMLPSMDRETYTAPAPNSVTFERLIGLLCSCANTRVATSQKEADSHLAQALKLIDECATHWKIVPTANTFEALIRTMVVREKTVGRSAWAGRSKWKALLEEMEDAHGSVSPSLKEWLEEQEQAGIDDFFSSGR